MAIGGAHPGLIAGGTALGLLQALEGRRRARINNELMAELIRTRNITGGGVEAPAANPSLFGALASGASAGLQAGQQLNQAKNEQAKLDAAMEQQKSQEEFRNFLMQNPHLIKNFSIGSGV